MVCYHLNLGVEAKLAKELHLLINVKSTLAHNQPKVKNGMDVATNIVSFKTNVPRTLDTLRTLRELKTRRWSHA
jgi:hypothetical protein